MEVVGARKNGARGTHTREVGPSSLACLSRALRSFQRVTSKGLLLRLKIRQLLMKIASLKFRCKGKKSFICMMKYWESPFGRAQ